MSSCLAYNIDAGLICLYIIKIPVYVYMYVYIYVYFNCMTQCSHIWQPKPHVLYLFTIYESVVMTWYSLEYSQPQVLVCVIHIYSQSFSLFYIFIYIYEMILHVMPTDVCRMSSSHVATELKVNCLNI